MTQEELIAELNQTLRRVAELGEAVGVALGSQEHTAADLAAILTAADVVKGLADDLAVKLGPSHSRNHRKGTPVIEALRKWGMGARLLYDGLADKSAALLQMGAAQFQTASQDLVRAVQVATQ